MATDNLSISVIYCVRQQRAAFNNLVKKINLSAIFRNVGLYMALHIYTRLQMFYRFLWFLVYICTCVTTKMRLLSIGTTVFLWFNTHAVHNK